MMSEKFDLDFRPKSYWGPQSLASYFGSHITGELRRKAAKNEAASGSDLAVPTEPTLDSTARSMQGAIHPWLMGGEYLPPLRADEVEIARVTLRSVTMDVFSIRARRSGERIYFRLVDEYMEQEPPERFAVKPRWAKSPLSMRQVISIIDENGLIDDYRDLNFDGTNADEIFNFATASSEFYPELAAYFDHQNEKWLEEQIRLSSDDADE
jgi:hypothetical protein